MADWRREIASCVPKEEPNSGTQHVKPHTISGKAHIVYSVRICCNHRRVTPNTASRMQWPSNTHLAPHAGAVPRFSRGGATPRCVAAMAYA